MEREERKRILELEKQKLAAEQAKKTPEQIEKEKADMQKLLKEGKAKYNRNTGKIEVIE